MASGAKASRSSPQAASIRQKVELRFEKGEAVRFISHHDLMRAFQRAVRRAAWPVRLTQGFNPRPRIVFPMALEVGIASLDEVAEIELNECLPLNQLKTRLEKHLPPGLAVRALREVPPTRNGQRPVRIRYRLHLNERGLHLNRQALQRLRSAPALPFERRRSGKKAPPRPEPVDLKPHLGGAELDPEGDLVLDLKPNQGRWARPLEVLSLLTGTRVELLKDVRVTKLKMDLAPARMPPNRPAQPETNRPPPVS